MELKYPVLETSLFASINFTVFPRFFSFSFFVLLNENSKDESRMF